MCDKADSVILLYETTMNLVENIKEINQEELLDLVEMRDEVLKGLEMQPDITSQDRLLLKKIIDKDAAVQERLNHFRLEALQGLDTIQRSRIQKQHYEQSHKANGFLFDLRK